MISTAAWRSSIGSFHRIKLQTTQNRVSTDTSTKSAWFDLAFVLMIMSASLINTLLIIGSIEQNPGPTTGIFLQYKQQ